MRVDAPLPPMLPSLETDSLVYKEEAMNPFQRSLVVLFAVVLAAAWAGWATAQEEAAAPTAQEGEAPAADPAMEAMMAAMAPGPQHEMLASRAGTWSFTMTFWPEPGAPPQTATGAAERAMAFGGRVLEESITSEVMGMPFEGVGHTGYDNVTGDWWSIWMDNMSTGVIVMQGSVDEESHTATWEGEMSDPMAGGKTPMKIVSRHEGPDKEVAEFYGPNPAGGGEMVKTMEIVYERQQ